MDDLVKRQARAHPACNLKRVRSYDAMALAKKAGIAFEPGRSIQVPEWAACIIDAPLPFETRLTLLQYGAEVAVKTAAIGAALRLGGLEAALALMEKS